MATAIARLVLYPDGTLEGIGTGWRIGAVTVDCLAFIGLKRSIVASQVVLLSGAWVAGLM